MELDRLSQEKLEEVIPKLTPKARQRAAEILQALKDHEKFNQLDFYKPFPKQLEFHAAGKTYKERLFRAGNRVGKSWTAAAEVAIHVTGRYPEWWNGRVYKPTENKPLRCYVLAKTDTTSRDTVQRILLGEGEPGTGMLPKDSIIELRKAVGIPGCYEYVKIKHKNGSTSTILFKAYSEGRDGFEGDDLDLVWCDEEPTKWEIYSEALTRTNSRNGSVIVTFTPLAGQTTVVKEFMRKDRPKTRTEVVMTWHDRPDWTPEQIEAMAEQYPEHEREARVYGRPVVGDSNVYPVSRETLAIEPFEIPKHFRCIGGIDFGIRNAALVQLCYDPDEDIIYLTKARYLKDEIKVTDQAEIMKSWGPSLPWSWPHDGEGHDRGTGDTISTMYRKAGVRMLAQKASFLDGSIKVEPGVQELLERMLTGRFRVFKTLSDWFDEQQNYVRDGAKIPKGQQDHLLDATRYAFMGLRYAVPHQEINKSRGQIFKPLAMNNSWMV